MTFSMWTREQIFKLIDLFHEKELLWNTNIDAHKNRQKKNDAWEEIAKELNLDRMLVEKKMRSLMGQFQREIKRSKADATKWFAYKKLLFLKHRSKPEQTFDGGGGGSSENNESIEYDPIPTEQPKLQPLPQPQPEYPTFGSSFYFVPTIEPPQKRSKILEPPAITTSNVKETQNDAAKSETEEDEFDIYGKYIATQLKKLSQEQAVIGQDEIQRVITRCRLNDLRNKNRTYTDRINAPMNSPTSTNTQIIEEPASGPSNAYFKYEIESD